MARRTVLIYGGLAAAWLLVVGWLMAEHFRVRKSARAALVNRAKDISTTVGVVVRSLRQFGGVLPKERLESALRDLVGQELSGIAMLNAAGNVVASAGASIDPHTKGVILSEPLWEAQTVTLMNLMDLGTNVTRDIEVTNRAIVLSRDEFFRPFDTNRPPPPPGTNADMAPRFPGSTNAAETMGPPPPGGWRGRRGSPDGRPRFARPFWMSEEEYKSLLQKQGLHSFVIAMPTDAVRAVCRQDLWLRGIIGVLATVSVLGSALSWRSLSKSADLQIRLVRASEMTSHLKEMNLAAAGLAHETRNPLNIIRGLAQMISRQEEASPEIRQKSRAIVEEADRVTGQLNQFINYSRPLEVRRTPVVLEPAVSEVARALGCDLEEKAVRLRAETGPLTIQADEQMFRQALFNLMLNAIQAVEPGGEIEVRAGRSNSSGAWLEVRDNGPGVPPERRAQIFKPYFTTNQKGTGLGLAIVSQIVLAHGWEIACLANEPRGAIFRISHITLASSRG